MAAGDATAVVTASAWRCPRGHKAVYRERDAAGSYWGCRICGNTDNGLEGAEPFRILPKAQKGQERLLHNGHDSETVEETTQELRARLKRHRGRFAGGTQRRQG